MAENNRDPWELFAELEAAVERGDAEGVSALLDAGAEADAVSDLDDPTLLMRAAEQGRLDIVMALVAAGANVNAEAEDCDLERRYGERIAEAVPGVCALLYAGLKEHGKVYKYLHARTDAKLRRRVERVLETLKRVQSARPKNRGGKALCEAALRGDLETVRSMLAGGTDINAQERSGSTALLLAAALNHREMVEFLLEGGADVGVATNEEMTAIHSTRDPAIIDALLKHGADPNAAARYGYRPLHFACGRRHDHQQAQALLNGGAEVNAVDESGESPLHVAAQFAPAGIVRMLVGCGADVHARTDEGRTAVQLASGRRDPDAEAVLDILRSAGAT